MTDTSDFDPLCNYRFYHEWSITDGNYRGYQTTSAWGYLAGVGAKYAVMGVITIGSKVYYLGVQISAKSVYGYRDIDTGIFTPYTNTTLKKFEKNCR